MLALAEVWEGLARYRAELVSRHREFAGEFAGHEKEVDPRAQPM